MVVVVVIVVVPTHVADVVSGLGVLHVLEHDHVLHQALVQADALGRVRTPDVEAVDVKPSDDMIRKQ